jgi:hypothetical protein
MTVVTSDTQVPVKMRTRSVLPSWSLQGGAACLCLAVCTLAAVAAPVDTSENAPPAAETDPVPAAESPVDVDTWVQRETLDGLLKQESEQDRTAVLQESWSWRPPTWIQNHSAVNLGDFPTLDDPTGAVERNLQTLEWALAEQRRLAAGQRAPAPVAEVPPTRFDDWVRQMAPQEVVSTLKEHREWVAAGGAALLVILWGTTLFARRPSRHVTVEDVPKPPEQRRRRRRTRHAVDFVPVPSHRASPGAKGSGRYATRPAPLGPPAHRATTVLDPWEQDTEPMPLRGSEFRADPSGS